MHALQNEMLWSFLFSKEIKIYKQTDGRIFFLG